MIRGDAVRAVVPAVAAATVVLIAGLLYGFGYRDQYYTLLQYWGALPFRFPFLDMHAVTSAVECHRLGFDVYAHNPCDVFQRVHGYSPLWLWLAALPVTTGWDTALGLAAVVLFLVALPLLPPGRGWWQTAVIALGTVSSLVMFALERANVDVVIFLLAMLAIGLTRRSARLRMLGYAVALLAGMLKFYPVTLLILAVRERLGAFIAIGVVASGVIGLWFMLDSDEILRSMANIPTAGYFDEHVFGARDLPYGLAQIFGWSPMAARGLHFALLAGIIAVAVALAALDDVGARLRQLTDLEATSLMVGCILLVVCFVTAQNIQYRGIYFLFVLPGLTALARAGGERRRDAPYIGAIGSIIVLMWSENFRIVVTETLRQLALYSTRDDVPRFEIWLVREVLWWACLVVLAALLLRLLWDSRAARQAVRLMSGWTASSKSGRRVADR
jgi:hypothetical protein